MLRFHDIKTETDVIGAMAGEGVKPDFYPFYPARFPGDGLLFDGINNGANKSNFVHRSNQFLFNPIRILIQFISPVGFRSPDIANHRAIIVNRGREMSACPATRWYGAFGLSSFRQKAVCRCSAGNIGCQFPDEVHRLAQSFLGARGQADAKTKIFDMNGEGPRFWTAAEQLL